MARRYRTGTTQSQRNSARGIDPLMDARLDARDRDLPRGPQYRRYTRDQVPPDHLEWAQTRYLYPYTPTAPISAVYPFAATRGTFNLRNGWAVGTL